MQHLFSTILVAGLVLTITMSAYIQPAHAARPHTLEVAGWIPYWNDSNGIKDAKKNIKLIDTVYPFAFTVASDGSIKDQAGLTEKDWQSFGKTALQNDVEVIPTVMWSDTESMHAVLSSTTTRALHIEVIRLMVEKGKYAGVDIDYENKKADTKDAFSAFLTELKTALGSKILSCTVEARTPPESLYKEIPNPLRYSNDYTVIAKVCDRVVLMAYDQQRADLLLNKSKNGAPYFPLADVDWVRKVVELALKDIPKEKIVLGIPTYGYHYEITVEPDWFRDYKRIGALNLPDMLDVAKENRATPTRNKAGEMSFTYLPKDSPIKLSSSLRIPKNTPKGNIIAARALAYANKTGEEVTFRIGWYSDALAMKQKIDLAQEYKLRGISLFKIDGEEDKKVWQYLK